MKVYVLQGWFGDTEWIEGIYTDKFLAEADCARLWKSRTSEYWEAEDYRQGLMKFDVWDIETR